eukprot:454157_1
MNFQLNTSKHSNTPSPIHNRYNSAPTLPLSTTKEAIETQIAFITHAKHKQPEISLEPINNGNINNYYFHTNKQQTKYKLFSPNPFYPGQSLPILVQIHQQPPLPSSI